MAVNLNDKIADRNKLSSLDMSKIESCGGGLFLVPTDLIDIADDKITKPGENGEIVFANPRHGLIMSKVIQNGEGMSAEDIAELRDGIKNDGLDHPLLTRPNDGRIQVVNGERRLRQIKHFISRKMTVKDKVSGEMKPAAEVYSHVICRIEEMTDLEAYRRASSTDDSSVNHGDGAKLAQVRYLALSGVSDRDIQAATCKPKSWLDKVKPVAIALDDKTFEAFHNGSIAFEVALYLSKQQEVAERVKLLKQFLGQAKARHKQAIADAESAVQATAGKVTGAKAKAAGAKGSKKKEADEAVKKAEQKHSQAKKTAAATKKKKAKATKRDLPRASNPRAGSSRAGSKKSGGSPDGVVKRLTTAKQTKFWYDPALAASKALRKGAEDENIDDKVDPEFYEVVRLLHEKADAGEEDINKIGRQYTKAKERRQSK